MIPKGSSALRRAALAVAALGGPVPAMRAAWRRTSDRGPGVLLDWTKILFGGAAQRNDYGRWIRFHDSMDDAKRSRLRAEMEAWQDRPLVSVLMPVFDPPVRFLREAIDSVQAQIYPDWELCIADDGSANGEVRDLLAARAAADARVRVVRREANGGIAAASNTALGMACGAWIAFLDHDDLLAENALFELVSEIRRHPQAQLVYSDEDKVNATGLRFGPYFKPDWNLALFRSHNLITHFAAYRRELVQEIGGFREGFEGAQDYDLALRCVERLRPPQIRHIPRILYHWRSHAGSTASLGHEAKPLAMKNGCRALQEHLVRKKIPGQAELIGHGFRMRYALPDPAPKVTLIIPTKDRVHLIERCVASLLEKTDYPNFEIVVADNGTTEPSALAYLESLRADGRAHVLRIEGTFNFARLNNEAVCQAKGQIVGLLNSDLQAIDPGWLREMASLTIQPDVGAVGALLLYADRRVQHGGIILGIGGWAGHAHKGFPEHHQGYAGRLSLVSEFSAVTGACLLVRKSLYDQFGGLDEGKLAVACNDVDFCLRLREAGYRNVWTPFAKFIHHESASRGYEDAPDKLARFEAEKAVMRQRWGEKLLHDPCYNPNLTLESEDFSLAWPPRHDDLTLARRP